MRDGGLGDDEVGGEHAGGDFAAVAIDVSLEKVHRLDRTQVIPRHVVGCTHVQLQMKVSIRSSPSVG